MSNEQKLREALHIAVGYIDMDALYTVAGGDYDTIKEALATTEPEPTGMPELHPVAHIELGDDSHDVVTIEAAKAYGEQCWKAGYKHGAWGDKPAVNQQLTTEPVDEREAFENEMMRRKSWTVYDFQPHPRRGEYPHPDYIASYANTAWAGWQARAAMTKVGDINVVESFTNDTKDALMAGRAYAQEALIRFDDAYDRHPSTEPERNAILADIQLIDAAMAKGVKG